jgi:F-type H+-transporting ATPase subunit a
VAGLVIVALMILSKIYMPVPLPHIQLPAETVFMLGGFRVTNTVITMLTADLILILLALRVRSKLSVVPGRLQGFFELIIEYWKNMAEQLVGAELGKKLLPLVLTMFLLIVTSNWIELLPGVDSVGFACVSGECPGEDPANIDPEVKHTYFSGFSGPGGLFVATARDDAAHGESGSEGDHGDEAAPADDHEGRAPSLINVAHAAGEGEAEGVGSRVLVPFYRVTASDLNFTLALAIIAFLVIEWAGFRELGLGYLRKFFNFDFSHGVGQGLLNVFVGLLELVSELARIVSFSFRLFGNLFAGQILLFVMPFLIPLFLALPFYGLETFVGMIQGFVFAMLTLVFASVAIQPHDH